MLCTFINGFYKGSYQDTTGLFPDQAFPIHVYLVYENNRIYGYTLKDNDKEGAGYGVEPYALIWGNCENNQITNFYVIKNTSQACGDPAPGPMPLSRSTNYTLQINYENAMINANLNLKLSPSGEYTYSIPEDAAANQTLINQAIQFSEHGVQSCH